MGGAWGRVNWTHLESQLCHSLAVRPSTLNLSLLQVAVSTPKGGHDLTTHGINDNGATICEYLLHAKYCAKGFLSRFSRYVLMTRGYMTYKSHSKQWKNPA